MLSIEITRECPLHCPGCYAYGDTHLGGSVTLRFTVETIWWMEWFRLCDGIGHYTFPWSAGSPWFVIVNSVASCRF